MIINIHSMFKILLLMVIIYTSTAYAGGDSFDIKIHHIETVSKHQHIIKFEKLTQIGNHAYGYPLDNCKTITLTVNYKYRESKIRQFLLFFQLLFGDKTKFNQGVNKLNHHINLLKINLNHHPNTIYTTNDIEAFQYNPKNVCQLYSKTLEVDNDGGIDHKKSLQFFVRN